MRWQLECGAVRDAELCDGGTVPRATADRMIPSPPLDCKVVIDSGLCSRIPLVLLMPTLSKGSTTELITLRPCCIANNGTCSITTLEFCQFYEGKEA